MNEFDIRNAPEFGDYFVIYGGRYFTRESFFARFKLVFDDNDGLCNVIDRGAPTYELDPEECNDVIDDPELVLGKDRATPYMDTIMMTHQNFLNFALAQTLMTRVELEELYVSISEAKTDAEKFWLAVAAVVGHRK